MGRLISIIAVIALCISTAFAQQHENTDSLLGIKIINGEEPHIPTNELRKHMGKAVYIYDNIWGVNLINDSLKILYVGGRYPNHLVTILIKGRKLNQKLSSLYDGVASHFSGMVEIYEGKPAIIITSEFQTGKQIML